MDGEDLINVLKNAFRRKSSAAADLIETSNYVATRIRVGCLSSAFPKTGATYSTVASPHRSLVTRDAVATPSRQPAHHPAAETMPPPSTPLFHPPVHIPTRALLNFPAPLSQPHSPRPLRLFPRPTRTHATCHIPRLSADPVPPARPRYPTRPLRDLSHGLLSSTIGSLIGAGGGVILTPLLTLTRVSQHEAHGTSLLVIAVTACISALRYFTRASVDVPAAVALMSAALLAAPVGARASAALDARKLKRCFGAFLVFVSIAIPLMPKVALMALGDVSGGLRITVLAVVGVLSGFLSGLLGIGGGTINVPTLVFLGFTQTVAQGTALMAMVFPSMRGAYAHFRLGHVRAERLPGLVIGAMLGGMLGATTALRLQEGTLRVICSGIFVMIGIKYLMDRKKS